MNLKFELQDKENVGTIELGDKVRVSDPCYDIDTWCAGTLENVLPGTYHCFSQRSDTGDWGVRIANIEVRHKDSLDVEPTEVQKIDVGVDSGQCGIYDLTYFIEARKDKDGEDEWYDRVCEKTYVNAPNPKYLPFNKSSFWKPEFAVIDEILSRESNDRKRLRDEACEKAGIELMAEHISQYLDYISSIEHYETVEQLAANTMDNKCLVSSSGDGDGSYTCLVGRNKDGKIVSVKIDYYYGYDEDEDDDE